MTAAIEVDHLTRTYGKHRGVTDLTFCFYLLWVLASLSGRWHWLGRLTIFSAYAPQRALELGGLTGPELLGLAAFGIACAVAAVAIFQRRDAIG